MSDRENGATNGAEARRGSASEAELMADLKPAGALERMMVQQMARAHDTTMACFDRAEAATESVAREVELRLAARFMALFMQQAGTLDRRRVQARLAEEVARRRGFNEQAAQTRARMAAWEENLGRFEESLHRDELEDLDDLEDPGGLEALPDPAALGAMAERLGLPNPVGADGQVDPEALTALAERAEDMLLGGAAANGVGEKG